MACIIPSHVYTVTLTYSFTRYSNDIRTLYHIRTILIYNTIVVGAKPYAKYDSFLLCLHAKLPRCLHRTLLCGHLFEYSCPLVVKLIIRYAIRLYNTIDVLFRICLVFTLNKIWNNSVYMNQMEENLIKLDRVKALHRDFNNWLVQWSLIL